MNCNETIDVYSGYIYCISCKKYPYKKYIGQTIQKPEARFKRHRNGAFFRGRNSRISRAIKEFGEENFNYDVIESKTFNNKDELNEWLDLREKYYIALFDTTDINKGYNVYSGGSKKGVKSDLINYNQYDLEGNLIASYTRHTLPEQYRIDYIIEASNGEKFSAYNYIWRKDGVPFDKYPLPAESRKKAAETRRKSLEPIIQYDLNGNIISIYNNIYDVCNKLGLQRRQVTDVCNGLSISYNNMIFRFHEDEFNKYDKLKEATIVYVNGQYKLIRNNDPRKIYIYNSDGELINTYNSFGEVKRHLKIDPETIKLNIEDKTPYLSKNNELLAFSYSPMLKEEVLSIIKKGYPVYVYDREHNLLSKHTSYLDAGEKYGVDPEKMSLYFRGINDTFNARLLYSPAPLVTDEDFKKAEKGCVFSDNRSPVTQYDLSLNFIATYESISKASISLCGSESKHCGISDCCNGKLAAAYGYIWRYYGDPIDKYPLPTDLAKKRNKGFWENRNIKIVQYDLSGKVIHIYNNPHEAAKAFNTKPQNIKNVCTGKAHTLCKYIFRFEGDEFDKYGDVKNIKIHNNQNRGIRAHEIYMYNHYGELIEHSNVLNQLCKDYNISHGAVEKRLKTGEPLINGEKAYLFSPTPLSEEEVQSRFEDKYKVYVYNKDGTLFGKYFSYLMASKDIDVSSTTLQYYMKGKTTAVKSKYDYFDHSL